ncbi:hypothetical protein LCGC14_3021780, partial [marine sediment metagenome]
MVYKNIMKGFATIISILALTGVLTLGGIMYFDVGGVGTAARVIFPFQGGTGTSSAPTQSAEFLIWNDTTNRYDTNRLTAGSNITLTPSDGNLTITGAAGGAAGGGLWTDAIGFIYSGLTSASTTNETVLIGNTATNTTNKLEVWGNISADIFIATSTTATSTFAGGLTVDTTSFVDDAGRVGIGTAAPVTKLSIKGNDDKDTGPIITLNGNAINQVESGRIRFAETDMYYQGGFIHFDGSANTFNIGVHDNADNLTSSDINAISILRSNGNVGIGTVSPQKDLHIESGVPTIRMSDDNAATDQAVATL